MRRRLPLLALLLPLLLGAAPEEQDHHHGGDLKSYVKELEDPARERWQLPDRVVQALELRPGMVVVDLGAGTGYFTRRLAAAVAPGGKVLALDTEDGMLRELGRRTQGLANVEAKRVAPDDAGLAPASVDLIFICNTGHHLPDRVSYYAKLREALRPGGRLVLVDFYRTQLPVGPPVERKLSRRATQREAERAGFRLAQAHSFLPYQYFLVFVPAG